MTEPRRRLLVLVSALLMLGGVAVAYSANAARRSEPAKTGAALDALRPGQLLFRTTAAGAERGRVAAVPLRAPGGARAIAATGCERFYAASGTGVCLVSKPGPVPKTYALITDRSLREVRRVKLAGIPNRARVSASGRMVSWTVFVTGDAYNKGAFSTWTGILDTRTGYVVQNIEEIPLTLDGRRYRSPDVNFWGVTFAVDDNRFYATVSTKGRTYLVQGDYAKWEARTLRENAECPSLSPDGTRLAFKKRISRDPAKPWRLYVLDLRTMRETPLAEPHSVDDQAAWLNDRTVMYARPHGTGDSNVWSVPADGSGTPRVLVPNASSPVGPSP